MDEMNRTIIDTNGCGGTAWCAENQALKAQLFTVNAMAQQTQAIINALKPTTTTGA